MNPRRVYTLLGLIMLSIILLVTGHMDMDWRVVSYYFDGIQNNWGYWEYCPFIKINWWLAYFIDTVKMAAGWFLLGATLTYIGVQLSGDNS